MLGIKTFLKERKYYSALLEGVDKKHFPDKPVSKFRQDVKLAFIKWLLNLQNKQAGLSGLVTDLDKNAVFVWSELLGLNPNNHGNRFEENSEDLTITEKIEKELVVKMIDLYHANGEDVQGYMTSGGTESNIFSGWMGRNFLESKKIRIDEIAILKTGLTHHSIDKAADLLHIKKFSVRLNDNSWGMDVKSFGDEITKLVKMGFRGFMLPLTFGYTLTGTSDPVKEICESVELLTGKLKVTFFVWIDASFNGLIEPFLNPEYRPFKSGLIQTYVTDFHKAGHVPLPAGLLLYKRNLIRTVEKPISYLEQKDNTLLGSRSGIPPVACWFMIHSQGKLGIKNFILGSQKIMKKFINEFADSKSFEIVYNKNSLNCAIIAKHNDRKAKEYSKKYGFEFRKTSLDFVSGKKELLISKCFFLNKC